MLKKYVRKYGRKEGAETNTEIIKQGKKGTKERKKRLPFVQSSPYKCGNFFSSGVMRLVCTVRRLISAFVCTSSEGVLNRTYIR
jgi:hypothetical protein